MLENILRRGFVHTGYYQGSGRRSKAIDLTSAVTWYLDKIGSAYETGNDAPRGGVSGNFVKITMPAFLKEVKKVIKSEEEARKAYRMEVEKKIAAKQKHLEEVKTEAAKLDLEPFRKEIDEIVGRVPNENFSTFSNEIDTLSRKEIGRVVWMLSHRHKGFNTEVLKHALYNFRLTTNK